jgi:hypothetical protein
MRALTDFIGKLFGAVKRLPGVVRDRRRQRVNDRSTSNWPDFSG